MNKSYHDVINSKVIFQNKDDQYLFYKLKIIKDLFHGEIKEINQTIHIE